MSDEVAVMDALEALPGFPWVPVVIRERHNGPQLLFRFPNGWGLSVIGEIDFDAWYGSAFEPRQPPPLIPGEVEMAAIVWQAGAADDAAVDERFVLRAIIWEDGDEDAWSDQVIRHVPLGDVRRYFERVAALTPYVPEVEG